MQTKDMDMSKEYTDPLFVGLSRKPAVMKQSMATTKTINGIAVRIFAALYLFLAFPFITYFLTALTIEAVPDIIYS